MFSKISRVPLFVGDDFSLRLRVCANSLSRDAAFVSDVLCPGLFLIRDGLLLKFLSLQRRSSSDGKFIYPGSVRQWRSCF